MHRQSNRLADRRGGPVRQGHEPRFRGSDGEGKGGYAGAESETFEGLVEGYCDEEDDEGGSDGEGEGEADEDGVEEDTGFEEEALEEKFLGVARGGRCGGGVGGWYGRGVGI